MALFDLLIPRMGFFYRVAAIVIVQQLILNKHWHENNS